MRKTARAPSWINMAIGIWVLLSPWLLGFTESGGATWTAAVTGLAITMVAAVAVARPAPTASWGNLLLAIWLFVSPWVVGYTEFRSASRNAWFIAVMVALFAFITLVTASPERDDRRSPLDTR
jgi:SPW repeat